MIKQEFYDIVNGVELVRTYSDEGYYIEQVETGLKYEDAVDVPGKFHYIESSEKIETE